MKKELHFICLSCSKMFILPQKEKDCDKCRRNFKKGVKYSKCSKCENAVINPKYPLCPEHYYANKNLDTKLYHQYFGEDDYDFYR